MSSVFLVQEKRLIRFDGINFNRSSYDFVYVKSIITWSIYFRIKYSKSIRSTYTFLFKLDRLMAKFEIKIGSLWSVPYFFPWQTNENRQISGWPKSSRFVPVPLVCVWWQIKRENKFIDHFKSQKIISFFSTFFSHSNLGIIFKLDFYHNLLIDYKWKILLNTFQTELHHIRIETLSTRKKTRLTD